MKILNFIRNKIQERGNKPINQITTYQITDDVKIVVYESMEFWTRGNKACYLMDSHGGSIKLV